MTNSEPSKELVVIDKSNLPETIDLLLSHPWPREAVLLIKEGPTKEYDDDGYELPSGPSEDKAFQELASHCKGVSLDDTHTYAMMVGMAKKWGVVIDEPRENFIVKAISRAVVLPSASVTELSGSITNGSVEVDTPTRLMNFMEILETEFEVEWIMEGILTKNGIIAFCGPPGVGKTMLLIRWCIALATGSDFLGFKVNGGTPQRILFLSLEMIQPEIKRFLRKMAKTLTDEEKELLRENFIFHPLGTSLHLNDVVGQAEYVNLINEAKPDGIIIDSWSQAAKGNLNDDTVAREAFDFLNKIRKRTGCFVGIINHMRKPRGDHLPNTMDDIFGSVFFSASVSNAIVVWPKAKRPNEIELHVVKSRFAPKPVDPLVVRRTELLDFIIDERSVNAFDVLTSKELESGPSTPKQSAKAEKKKASLSKAMEELMGLDGLGGDFKFFKPGVDDKASEYSQLDDTIEGFQI